MSNIVPHRPHTTVAASESLLYEPRQLQLIRDTVAKDCDDREFDLFINGYCRPMNLNPLRKQIYAFVFNKDKPAKRQMSVVIAVDGFRAIAARSGNYRPGKTTFEVNESLKDPLSNPEGLVSATAVVHQFSHGAWHEIEETAWWTEQAPMVEDGDFTMVETGEFWDNNPNKPKKRKQFTGETRKILDTKTQWPQRGRTMLAKCAEAKAIRRGWPEDLPNVYAEEEVAHARAEQEPQYLSPAEAVAAADEQTRRERAGLTKDTILLDLMISETAPLQAVPLGQFFDRVAEFVEKNRSEPSRLMIFRDRNMHGLREFWSKAPKDCNKLKAMIQEAIDNPPAEEQGAESDE